MNASELHRKLHYCGYADISAYLTDNAVNRYIYKQLINVWQRYGVSTSTLKLFNEVYYQCVKVQTDSRPGEEVQRRYLKDAEAWLGSCDAALLVVSIVWALLQRKYKKSFSDECFVEQIAPFVEKGEFVDMANGLISFMQNGDIYSPQEFKTMPCPVNELPTGDAFEGDEMWRTVTEKFTPAVIERLLTLYSNRAEQGDLLNCIIGGMSYDEKQENRELIRRLRENINKGDYLPLGNYFDNQDKDDDPDTDYDFMFAAGLKQTMEEAYDDRAEQYKQERDTYKYRLEEQKKAHAAELARIEANYQAEIARLKTFLEQQPQTQAPAPETTTPNATTTDPAFTLTEMVALVKERFSKPGADEVSAMFYSLAAEHRFLDGDVLKLINGIVPAILQRDSRNQYFELPNVQQFNNNPGNVNNNPK